MTQEGMAGVGADRLVVERSTSAQRLRVIFPAGGVILGWWLGGRLDDLGLGGLGLLPTLAALWMAVDLIAALVDWRDRRLIEVGQDGVWLADTGYRPWTDFADIRLEPAQPETDVSILGLPRLKDPRRLGFVPRGPVSGPGPAAPRMARTIRRVRDRLTVIALRPKSPGAPLGVAEREVGRDQFERLLRAVANEVPLGGVDQPAAAPPTPTRPVVMIAIAAALGIGLVGTSLASFAGRLPQDEAYTEPEFTFDIEEPFTDRPIDEVTEPPASDEETTIPVPTAGADDMPEPPGELQELEITGIVPDGAQTARISIHVNGDELCCAEADLTLYELSYLEDDPEGTTVVFTNLFASEGDWASTGDGSIVVTGSDLEAGLMLRVFAAEDESVGIDAPFFDVHGATTFHATLRLRVAPWSGGSSLALVRFFADGTEVGSTSMELPALE